MWSGFFKDRDLKMKLCLLLLCCLLAVQNVRVVDGKDSTSVEDEDYSSKNADNPNEITSIQDFSLDLYEAVKKSQPQNFILSPLSVRNALAMLSLGAAGETVEEIRRSLKFPEEVSQLINNQSQLISSLNGLSSGNSSVKFVTADKIYANSGLTIKTEYKKDVTLLGGEIENVDFGNGEAAAGKINSWVKNKTEGKIDKIVEASDLSSQTSLFVLNSIYFKGSWGNKFNVSDTKQRPFFINASYSVNVSMMFQEKEFQHAELEHAKAQVILLPYQGERLSMMIYLPDGKEESSLDSLESWLKDKSPFDIQSQHLNKHELLTVNVSLPKFKIRSSLQLNEPLKTLGLGKMFDQSAANFSGIFDGSGNFFVSKVSQETFIEVNEEGTEAAAVTGAELAATSFSSTQLFTADRPFIFQIVDKETKTVLFSGRVKNPLGSVDSPPVDHRTDETIAAPNDVTPTKHETSTKPGTPTKHETPRKPETLTKDSTPTTTAPPTTRPQNTGSPQPSSAWGYAKSGLSVQTFLMQLTAILLLF